MNRNKRWGWGVAEHFAALVDESKDVRKKEQTCNHELILASVRGSARGVFASHYSRWVGHGLTMSQHQANTRVTVI